MTLIEDLLFLKSPLNLIYIHLSSSAFSHHIIKGNIHHISNGNIKNYVKSIINSDIYCDGAIHKETINTLINEAVNSRNHDEELH